MTPLASSVHPRAQGSTSTEGRLLLAILVGTVLFYLPFISKQFMGDDWLWLFHAKRAAADPSIFLARPMYGYFRPLNLAIVFTWFHTIGASPVAFSVVSILLHAANVWLLWRTLRRFGASDALALLSAFLFAFYFLNCSAIEWISVGHDLWVTGLTLLVAIKSADFADYARPRDFLALGMLGAAATLTKESGFVTLGIYLVVLMIRGKSPIERGYRWWSLTLCAVYLGYLILYMLTRTVVDREVSLGVGTLINLWYFLVYLGIPLSKRVVAVVPHGLTWILQLLKVTATLSLPLLAYHAWRRGGNAVRLFLVWPVLFLSTIAIMIWDVGLFDVYPERTATRFMYTPAAGFAVCVAWLCLNRTAGLRWLRSRALVIGIVAAYVVGNFLVVLKVSQEYFENQKLTRMVLESIEAEPSKIAACDTLIVFTDRRDGLPQLLSSGVHLEAIMLVQFDREVSVGVMVQPHGARSDAVVGARTIALYWNATRQRFDNGLEKTWAP